MECGSIGVMESCDRMRPFITPSLRYSIIPPLKLCCCIRALRNRMIIQDQAISHNNSALRVGGDVLFVRHHDDCDSALVELLKGRHDFDACAAVQIASGLVCKQDLWLVNQRASNCDALLLATGELTGMMVFTTGESG